MRADDHPFVSPFFEDIHEGHANGAALSVLHPLFGEAALDHGNMIAQHFDVHRSKFKSLEPRLAGFDSLQKTRLRESLARIAVDPIVGKDLTQLVDIAGDHG